jgi:hypothetical protein
VPVLLALFGLTTGALGIALWRSSDEYLRFRKNHPLPPYGVPGQAVDIDWLGDGVVVKVYLEHGAYAAHVYWRENFIGKAGGFASSPAAIGWGRAEARRQGADV